MIVVVLVGVLGLLRKVGHLGAEEINVSRDVVRESVGSLMTITQIKAPYPSFSVWDR